MEQFVLDVAGLSDRGMKREHNEDAWATPPENLTSDQVAAKGRLYLVADGVGGHLAGDVASRMAVEIIQQRYYADPSPDVGASLTAAIQAASQQIDHESAARLERRGMSTTVTAVVLRGNELTVANVGDSRTYLIRKGQAQQVTSDHTWVEEQVRVGLITREEAARHPQRNIITRSLGGSQKLEVDIFREHIEPEDSILLCSDGLSNMVTSEEIGAVVNQGLKAEVAVKELIELAKQRGAPDNVTAVLLNAVRPTRGGFGRFLLTAGILGSFALVAAGLAFGVLFKPNKNGNVLSQEPTPDTDTSLSSSPLITAASSTPVGDIFSPPELVWPAEDVPLAAGEQITFTWNWEDELEDGKFIFLLQPGEDKQPLVHAELPLNQRQFIISQPLDAGRYLWTLTVSGSEAQNRRAGRVFSVVEPTPTTSPRGSNSGLPR